MQVVGAVCERHAAVRENCWKCGETMQREMISTDVVWRLTSIVMANCTWGSTWGKGSGLLLLICVSNCVTTCCPSTNGSGSALTFINRQKLIFSVRPKFNLCASRFESAPDL